MTNNFWDRVGIKGYDKESSSSYHVRPFLLFKYIAFMQHFLFY